MKKSESILLLAASLSFLTPQITQADVIADWTFETTSNSITGSGTGLGPLAADIGSGSATGVHASSSSTWSHPAGNGSPSSFSVNTWGTGDYFQFSVSTVAGGGYYTNLSISYDQTGSGTGPRDFALEYSSNGSTFSTFGSSYIVLSNSPSVNNEGSGLATAAWSASGSVQSAFTLSFDLSSLTSLANDPTVVFRIVDLDTTSEQGATVAAAGTDRVDNFVVSGTLVSVPEPSALALAAFGGVACLLALRRKR